MSNDIASRVTPGDGNKLPYAPSWVDRFNAWIDRLPGSSWAYYLGIGLVLFSILSVVHWVEGARPVGTFLAAHGFLAGMIVLFPALLHYLDGDADAAFATLRPALETEGAALESLRYRLTTLPPLPTLLANLVTAVACVFISERYGTPSSFSELASFPISAGLIYGVYVLAWFVWGGLVYHTIHQLSVINHVLAEHTRISLFRMGPLYAFSSLTALTAVGLIIPVYAWNAMNQVLLDPIALALTLPVTALALAAFVWPLLGTRRLLAEEKGQMLDALSLRLEALYVKLHERVDREELEGVGNLNTAIATLEREQTALSKISTWPWQPETPRWLVTALVTPLVLWIIQYFLQRVLAP
jgi:hypothetical protein